MARAIVRYSLNGDNANGNVNGNDVRRILQDGQFDKIGTASLEADGPRVNELLEVLERTMQRLRQLPDNTRLDHLWIYVDEAEEGSGISN